MYVKRESEEEVARLLDQQYPVDIAAGQYYGELEVEDFNQLFWNQRLIEKKFGRSIKVVLECAGPTATRRVTEHPDAVKDENEQVAQQAAA